MLTRCPSCATVFRVDTVQLRAREGRVRCGRCHAVFDALDAMVELPLIAPDALPPGSTVPAATASLPAPERAPAPLHEPAPTPLPDATPPARLDLLAAPLARIEDDSAAAVRADAPPEPGPVSVADTSMERLVERTTLRWEERLAEADATAPAGADAMAPPVVETAGGDSTADASAASPAPPDGEADESSGGEGAATAPPRPDPLLDSAPLLEPVSDPAVRRIREELYGPDASTRRSRAATWAWGTGALLCLLLIPAQLAYLWRSELALAQPALQPALQRACDLLGCSIAPPRRIDLLSIESSELNPLPDQPPLLQLRALLRNAAEYAQDWPHLELTLTDAQDRVVVRRVLAPADYLPAPLRNEKFTARSERSVSVRVDPTDTGAGGYRLYVFYP
ncbi:DUF3426 domain-containing protein [Methyloversatilis thermotolerans]|uniref:DUF3426 domain-containing protein n=1 Tax=Methyloversatilis thermotolerans TaxID=1346290 RepID=UPI00035D391F|nr:DUF3426 domain-containing protein [Methyloversatilis thermotolerans]